MQALSECPRSIAHNKEADAAVLGDILLRNDAINEVMSVVTEDDFYFGVVRMADGGGRGRDDDEKLMLPQIPAESEDGPFELVLPWPHATAEAWHAETGGLVDDGEWRIELIAGVLTARRYR